MLNEQWITCFLTVVKNESFTKAAEELFLTQQAVSKHVKRLEEELGYQLFEGNTRHIQLTSIGEEYYHMFLKWKLEYQAMQERAEILSTGENQIRIGMLTRMNSGMVPNIIREMKAEHPDAGFSISHMEAVDLQRKLSEDELDLIVTYEDFLKADKQISREVFGTTQLMLTISENHPKAGDKFKLSDMDGEDFLLCLNKGETKQHAMKKGLEERQKFGLGEGPIRLFSDIDEVNLMTELGEGFSLCSTTNLFLNNPFIKAFPVDKITRICGAWRRGNKNLLLKEFLAKTEEIRQSGQDIVT